MIAVLSKFASEASNKCHPFFSKHWRGNASLSRSRSASKLFRTLKCTWPVWQCYINPLLGKPHWCTWLCLPWLWVPSWSEKIKVNSYLCTTVAKHYNDLRKASLSFGGGSSKVSALLPKAPNLGPNKLSSKASSSKPRVSVRMAKWLIELGEFHIEFVP